MHRTSRKIHDNTKRATDRTVSVPNAMEFSYFTIFPENTLLAHLKRRLIGHYGAIADSFKETHAVLRRLAEKLTGVMADEAEKGHK